MEQEEDFKCLQTIFKDFEHFNLNGDILEQMKATVINSIEVEFEKCLNALAIRKQSLLSEVEFKFQEEKKSLDEQKLIIATFTKASKELLQAGSNIYPISKDIAIKTWKSAIDLKPKTTGLAQISINFPASLFENIAQHGSVIAVNDPGLIPIPTAGEVSTLAGSSLGNLDGKGPNAKFNSPWYGCYNPNDNCLYVSDSENTIRRVTDQGNVVTFAGGQLNGPTGIAHYQKENCLYVCSHSGHMIKKITALGSITTFAGTGRQASIDGVCASFNFPMGITVDQQTGILYVTEKHAVRKVTPQGEVSTLAGAGARGFADGIGKAAMFDVPSGICFDEKDQSVLICDGVNNKIRKVDVKSGTVSTLCSVTSPFGIAVLPNGHFVVSSHSGHKLLLITLTDGKYETKSLVGSGVPGYEDGAALTSKFNFPVGVEYNATSNTCYVMDYSNHRIRKFTLV